ncbi:MAG: preprotein translocase subunit SecG [Holosporales bacterium]|jgi:preprotein translocase subunit SecG|nr:preprotein translocase subunit SecG [Holosporales bacterium]
MGILIAIHVFVTLLLIFIVLIQKNEGGSSLFANSGGGNMFSARGASNLLTKATWILSTIFLLNCILMATIASYEIKDTQSIIEHKQEQRAKKQQQQQPKESKDENVAESNSKAPDSTKSGISPGDKDLDTPAKPAKKESKQK